MTYETIFNVGDEAWVMYENKPRRFRIASIQITLMANGCSREVYIEHDHCVRYNPPRMLYHQAYDCFSTKEKLMQATFGDVKPSQN